MKFSRFEWMLEVAGKRHTVQCKTDFLVDENGFCGKSLWMLIFHHRLGCTTSRIGTSQACATFTFGKDAGMLMQGKLATFCMSVSRTSAS